jgi:hypothetical protein
VGASGLPRNQGSRTGLDAPGRETQDAPLVVVQLHAERLAEFGWPSRLWQRWTVLGLLRAAQRGGALGAEADAEYLADALLAPLGVELYYHQRRILGLPPGRIEAGARSLVPG